MVLARGEQMQSQEVPGGHPAELSAFAAISGHLLLENLHFNRFISHRDHNKWHFGRERNRVLQDSAWF